MSAVPSERLPERGKGGEHPSGGAALRARVLGERERIGRLSRIRELELGFQDGLLVPLAVVTGLAGASAGAKAVIVGGLAEAAAGALANVHTGLPISLAATGLALLALGPVKGRVARLALLRSGVQVLLVGGVSAAIGWVIGSLGPKLFGA